MPTKLELFITTRKQIRMGWALKTTQEHTGIGMDAYRHKEKRGSTQHPGPVCVFCTRARWCVWAGHGFTDVHHKIGVIRYVIWRVALPYKKATRCHVRGTNGYGK